MLQRGQRGNDDDDDAAAAATTTMTAADDDEQQMRRFAAACARDVPLLLTRYDEPQVLQRRPVRYSAFLRHLHAHQLARREDTNDKGDDTTLRGRAAAECVCDRLPDVLQTALPVAVGEEHVDDVDADEDDEDDAQLLLQQEQQQQRQQRDGSNNNNDDDDDDAEAALRMLPSTTQGEAYMHVMHYLLRDSSDTSGAGDDAAHATRPPPPRRAAQPRHTHATSGACATRDDICALFASVREVPSCSGEYVLLLYDALQSREAAGERVPECVYALTHSAHVTQTTQTTSASAVADEMRRHATEVRAVRAMVTRAMHAATRVADTTSNTCSVTTTVTNSSNNMTTTVTRRQLHGYTHDPLVHRGADTLLDALVPPRLLEYVDVSPLRVADEFARRERCRRVVARLYREYVRQQRSGSNKGNNNNNNNNNNSAHVLRELREACVQLQCGSDPIVGQVWVLLAQASRQWPSRAEMTALEADVDAHLCRAHARGAGRPLRSADFAMARVQGGAAAVGGTGMAAARHTAAAGGNSSSGGGSTGVCAPTTIVSHPAATTRRHATATLSDAAVRSNERNVVATTTMAAATAGRARGKQLRSGDAHTTAATSAAAAVWSSSNAAPTATATAAAGAAAGAMDGTVSVMSSLPLCELSAERRAVYFDLLAPELLRHVTLDLPERGVLLARVLREAAYAMHVHECLARESAHATAEQLVGGTDERATAAQRVAALSAEVAALQQRRDAAAERVRALREWSVQCRSAAEQTASRERRFREELLQRLRHTAEEIAARQERERHAAAVADGE